MSASVCAVLRAREGRDLIAALEGQTRPPDAIEIGLEAASHADWVWLLDSGAVPEPTALERLEEATVAPESMPSPALLASKVLGPDGSLDPLSLPVAQVRDPDFAVAAFEHRLLSLRVARRGSMLVHRDGVNMVASRWPTLSPFDHDLEWTARLLKQKPGLLVPASVVVRRPGSQTRARRARGETASRLRLLLGDAIELRDKPWFAFRFAEEALAGIRERGHS
ncbi:MAG: hypothetical protein ACR2J6_00865 [Thermoleophilaceae bacterium]